MVSPFPDNDNAVRIAIRFETDRQKIREALNASSELRKEFTAFKQETGQVNKVLEQEALAIQKVKIAGDKFDETSRGLTTDFKKMVSEIDKATAETNQLAVAFDKAEKEAKDLSNVAPGVAPAAAPGKANLTQIGVQLRNLPSQQIPGLGIGTDAIGNIFRTLGALSKDGGLPSLGEAAGLARQKIGEVVQAIGVGPVAFLGALGGLALAFQEITKRAQEAQKAAQDRLQFEIGIDEVRRESNISEVEEKLAEARAKQEDELGNLATAEERLAQLTANLTEEELIQISLRNKIRLSSDALTNDIIAASDAIDQYKDSASNATTEVIRLEQLLRDETVIRNTISDLTADYNEQLNKSRPVLDQLTEQHDQLTKNFQKQIEQLEEDQRIRAQFQGEDRQLEDTQRATAQTDRLIAIEQQGRDRIVALREQQTNRLIDLEQGLSETLSDISANIQQSISEENEEFRRDELARGREFRNEESRIVEDYRREQLRREQDNKEELLSAEEANDIAGFIQAKRRQRVEAERAQEDFDTGRQRRKEDFDEERRERQQAKQERIADIREETAERTNAAIAAFEKEKAALETKTTSAIETETAAIEQRTQAAINAYNKETEALVASRERADARAATLQAIQDSRRDASHQVALAQIQTRREAETRLFTDILIQINKLRNSLVFGSTGSAPGVSRNGQTVTAFATGGIVTGSTFARIGDRPGFHEALIPFRPSEGIERALAKLGLGGGSGSQTINVNIDRVEPGVTPADLAALKLEVTEGVVMGIASARAGQAPGAA